MENGFQLVVLETDIKQYARRLKKKQIGFFDVPKEYRLHSIIVKEERKLGLRKSSKRGYDIIHNIFFVEEIVSSKNCLDEVEERCISNHFSDFASYYEFLDGDIYRNACYYHYYFSQEEINTYNIDLSKINISALINITTKDFSIEHSEEELQQYKGIEKDKVLLKKWIDKFNACTTYEEFQKVVNNFNKSKFSRENLIFFIYNFIFSDMDKAFYIIMQYVSDGIYPAHLIEKALCSIYDPRKVLAAYNYNLGAVSTINRHKKQFKEYVQQLENKEVHFHHSSYFDENTHFFCHQVCGFLDNAKQRFPTVKIYRYFETFQELAEYLNNDLSNCDLSKAILPDVDFSVYETNNHTKLPIQNPEDLTYALYKAYDRQRDCFVVKQSWIDAEGQIVKEYNNTFKYFFDFVFFLANDLSFADLLFCDGLNNLFDFSNINFTKARLKSEIFDRIGTTYQLNTINTACTEPVPSIIVKNEEETTLVLTSKREIYCTEDIIKNQKIYYLSDLHLLHRTQNAFCKTKDDMLYSIQRIIDNLLDEVGHLEKNIILIGGDTSSDFDCFNLFIQLLRQSIDEKHLGIQVIFLLGNHELWCFPNCSFEEIVKKYEAAITEQKMYLLQNNIIYKDDNNNIKRITTSELLSTSRESIREQLKSARIILFGGLAFSGYNEEFNANNGIYRVTTIDRNQEIAESKVFESLYSIICATLLDRNVIIFTHTPQKDWCSHNKQELGFVYVSGHTHMNHFYDDGECRIYADNQIGYKHETPCFKFFYLEDEYDLFSEYCDGIYEITKEQYINFYRGKNIMMQFTRDVNILYMLKKNGYYFFVHQSKGRQLTVLNGGAMKRLDVKDINYYYDRMDMAIEFIKKPLDKYTSIQKEIASKIRAIGGTGTIHGAIIDIDFYNHIYVNPYDLTIKGYWATDIICKKVFSSIPKLLEENCPLLFANYTRLLAGKTETVLAFSGNIQEHGNYYRLYLDTDIYRASREIKKMQKLSSNILSTWYEPTQQMLE